MEGRGKAPVIGLIAMIAGPLFIMGGLMFLLAILMGGAPRQLLFPPLIQIALGLLTALAGFFLWRGHRKAGLALILIAIALLANLMFTAIGLAMVAAANRPPNF